MATDGGIFSYGDAPFEGSLGGTTTERTDRRDPSRRLVARPATSWFARRVEYSRSGVRATKARWQEQRLTSPLSVLQIDLISPGYWLVARDGGVFAIGAPFLGSLGGVPLDGPVMGIASS